MRKVRCVSPHGGCHHGQRADNGKAAPPGFAGQLLHPPNDGGYIDNAVLGTVAVGSVTDAPEPPGFIADGFHFVDDVTGKADECTAPGGGCWCGRHRHIEVTAPAKAAAAKPADGGKEL